jgi:hypothetical protein
MKRKIFFTLITLLIFVCLPLWAEVEVNAEVDKQELTTDELLTYKLTITTTEKNILQPQLPKFEGFVVVSTQQTANISLAKSNIKNIITYVFVLAPGAPGKLKIEPSQIKLKGKTYQSKAFDIEVKPGAALPAKPQEEEATKITL